MWFLWVLLIAILAYYVYIKITKPHSFWEEKGVKFVPPTPFIGNMSMYKIALSECMQKLYNHFPNERYVGVFQFLQPTLMLRDPKLIKKITIKEFDSFTDHRNYISEEADPLWNKTLFSMTGDRWKAMRPTLSPAFTSSKMKLIFLLMEECAQQLIAHLEEQQKDVIELEVKDLFSRYSNDVIATTAFGLKCDSLKERNNEFYLMGKDANNLGGVRALKLLIPQLNQNIAKFLGLKFVSTKVYKYFSAIIEETIATRENNDIFRHDMLQLLLDAKRGQLNHDDVSQVDTGFSTVQESALGKKQSKLKITNTDITAQALLFFLAGFETASTLMSFIAYELAVNPDVQERLRVEIEETWAKCGGKITYEGILGMKYLDMIVSETLRLWPPVPLTDRRAVKDFTIEPENDGEKPLFLPEGSILWISIYSIQRDAKYYKNPNKFDPERFSDNNKHKIDPLTYLPFGIGPRNCIGSRFGLLENKIVFFHIVKNFNIVPIAKTQIPVKLSKKHIQVSAEGGVWLGLQKRNRAD